MPRFRLVETKGDRLFRAEDDLFRCLTRRRERVEASVTAKVHGDAPAAHNRRFDPVEERARDSDPPLDLAAAPPREDREGWRDGGHFRPRRRRILTRCATPTVQKNSDQRMSGLEDRVGYHTNASQNELNDFVLHQTDQRCRRCRVFVRW